MSTEDGFKIDGETTIVLELLSGHYTADGRSANRLVENLYAARSTGLFQNYGEQKLGQMLYKQDETTNGFSLIFFLLQNGRFTVPYSFLDTAQGGNGILLPAMSKSDRLLLEFGNEKLRGVVEKEEGEGRIVENRSILLRKGIYLYIRLFLRGPLDVCKQIMSFLTNEISEASEQEQYSWIQWHEIPYILALLSRTAEKCERFGFSYEKKKIFTPGSISKACKAFSHSGVCRLGDNCPYLHDRRVRSRCKTEQILF